MRKITLALVIGIAAIILFFVIAFLYLVLAKPDYEKQEISNPLTIVGNQSEVVEEAHIGYILNEMGAYQLHNKPGSNENPLIEVKVDDAVFFSEAINGKITTRKEKTYEPDLRIITTNQEAVNALKSNDVKKYMKDSVASGKTNLELVSGYTELFFKGYLSLYKDLTGKSFTGSVIRIFGQG